MYVRMYSAHTHTNEDVNERHISNGQSKVVPRDMA